MSSSRVSHKAVVGARLIDGTGKPPVNDAIILIEGSKIADVGRSVDVPKDTEIIDANGKTIMPGMIDAHTHLGAPVLPLDTRYGEEQAGISMMRSVRSPMTAMYILKNAQANLEAGFTTLKEHSWVWDPLGSQAMAVRNAVNMGFFKLPRLVVYSWIGMTGGHCDMRLWFYPTTPMNIIQTGAPVMWPPVDTADGVSEVLKRSREGLRFGADGLKTASDAYELHGDPSIRWDSKAESAERTNTLQYSLEELTAMCDEAHRCGKLVSVHCHRDDSIKQAIAAGADVLEHCTHPENDTIAMLVKKKIINTATLGMIGGWPLRDLDEIWEEGQKKGSRYHERLTETQEFLMKKYKAGVRIAMGSDSCHDGRVHGHAARTTVMMVKYGMSEMDAIVATTKAAAEACKLEDQVGTLEGQKLADMIMVDGDPLKDIGVLLNKQKILMVMKEGEILIDRRGSQA